MTAIMMSGGPDATFVLNRNINSDTTDMPAYTIHVSPSFTEDTEASRFNTIS